MKKNMTLFLLGLLLFTALGCNETKKYRIRLPNGEMDTLIYSHQDGTDALEDKFVAVSQKQGESVWRTPTAVITYHTLFKDSIVEVLHDGDIYRLTWATIDSQLGNENAGLMGLFTE